MTSHAFVSTPVGELGVVLDDRGRLLAARTATWAHGPTGALPGIRRDAAAQAVAEQLAEYFAGTRQHFDLDLAPEGTDFQRQVWAALGEIPYGTTTTYGRLAPALGRPGAARAIGAAVGANPIAIIIPCHRVIGAQGQLTGYAGGLPMKIQLLEIEGISAGSPR